jgi:hypothetical protein
VAKGGTQQFTATVAGTVPQGVSWSITTTGINAGTTIDSTGKLTVASAGTKTSIVVTATSTLDDTKSDTATVTVTPGASADGTWTRSSLTLTISGSTWSLTVTGMPNGNFTGTYIHPTLSATVDRETFSGTVSSITSSSMTISGFPARDSALNGTWTKQSSAPEPEPSTSWTAVSNSTFHRDIIYGIAWGGASGQEKFVAVGDSDKMAYWDGAVE